MTTVFTIDNGNTSPSAGAFDSRGVLDHIQPLAAFLASSPIDLYPIVMADVGRNIPQLEGHPRLLRVGRLRKKHFFLDMPVRYASTLGEDRLVAAYQIYREGHGRVVLIDAGTFITVDLIDRDGFQGGHILPGPQTFLNAYSAGARLPTGPIRTPTANTGIPRNTSSAIQSSLRLYLVGTLAEAIAALAPVPKVFLTGGGSPLLRSILPDILPSGASPVFRPHLIHHALYNLHER